MGGTANMCLEIKMRKSSLRLEELTERGEFKGEDGFWRKVMNSVSITNIWKGESN